MLNLIAIFLVCSGIGIAVHIAIDLTHRPQSMKIMNAVWILSALWGSYLALWAYNKFGRSSPMKMEDDGMKGMGMSDMKDMDMSGMKDMNMPDMKGMDMGMSMGEMRRPYWQSVALSALHLFSVLCDSGNGKNLCGECADSRFQSRFLFSFILAGRNVRLDGNCLFCAVHQ